MHTNISKMLYFDPIMMNNNKYRWYKNPCLFVCFAKDCFRSCSNCSSRRKFIGSLISETQKIGWYWDIKVSFGRVVNCNSNYHISLFFSFFCLDWQVWIWQLEFRLITTLLNYLAHFKKRQLSKKNSTKSLVRPPKSMI